MENTKGYIAKKKKGSGDYEDLHLEGLEILQRLCGSVWTDYNEHDPGVTLLENISYALTELLHKCDVPMNDLLIPSPDQQLKSGDDALFTASDILTTDPITFNDYRKLWIDRITNVKNVWIYPVDSYHSEVGNIKGLMHVYVEKYTYYKEDETEKEDNQRIINELRAIYHNHRNLCEDLYNVEIYEPLELTMQFRISIQNSTDGEEVLANIYHEVNNYLAPEVNYYSLRQLQEREVPVNEIFNGPYLSNGFILDEDLKDPLDQIVISEIIKLISKVSNIVNILDFSLLYTDKSTGKVQEIRELLDLPKNTAPIVKFPVSNEKLIFEHSGVLFHPDLKETKKQLSFIQALNYSGFKVASDAQNKIQIPKGNYQEISSYYPISKQLPELYGVGERGIGNSVPPLRKAQVRQLKAYLMPFDQMMINFQDQLDNIFTLYDVNNKENNSYFTSLPPDVRELEDLIVPEVGIEDMELSKYWESVLKLVNQQFDANALERFNTVTDQLLSRFGEEFRTYSLSKINSNSYGEELTSQRFEGQMLDRKRELVRLYKEISYTRARSFNYHERLSLLPADHENEEVITPFIPGLFKKVALVTGIDHFGIRSLTKIIQDSGIKVHARTLEIEVKAREIDIVIAEVEAEDTEIVEIEEVVISEKTRDDLHEVMHYLGKEDQILHDVLKKGVLKENYTIKKDPNAEDVYYVLFKRAEHLSNIAHIAKSEEVAKKAIQQAINYLVGVNQKSEGFFVLEHLLLLPPYHGSYFGFYIDLQKVVDGLDIQFVHHELSSCGTRDDKIKTLIDQFKKGTLNYHSTSDNGCYVLQIKDHKNEVLAVSKTLYDTEKEVEEKIRNIEAAILQIDLDVLAQAFECYVYYGKEAVNEDFFSFQMTLIMPSWPVRFQESNFRRMFENTLYEEAPIHIHATIHWLDYEVVHLFEAYYFAWMELLINQNSMEDQMYQAYQLITMLQELQGE